ncbi:MAG: P-loop NTPase fold protein [Acidimicrobiales bacterium]|jgi:hypothetical protein
MIDAAEDSVAELAVAGKGDAPITSLAEDRLGRVAFAKALAAEVLVAPVTSGYVMGLTGPWGSGKTSILNMTVDALDGDALVVQFNPWMFSGTEALVSSFFDEIGKQLGGADSRLKGLADKLSLYGHLLSPLASFVGAGNAVSAAADVMQQLASRPSIQQQRAELREQLAKLDRRLVVVVDDVDRLRPEEILDVVRLVRLVGDFPNTLYLLAFDRRRVEDCLGEGDSERGRAYLEKIVQVTHDVPAAREPDVSALFVDGFQALSDDVTTGPFDKGDWQNIFTFVVRPLLRTPRHVRRLLGSLSMTMRLVGDEVAVADLIGIEAVRVLRPAMFAAIVDVADDLAPISLAALRSGYVQGRTPENSPIAQMYRIDPSLAESVCRWLFPAARRYFENMNYGSEWEVTWRRQRKVASPAVFRFYLERQLPDGVVPASVVDAALRLLTDGTGLAELLEAQSPAELMDLVERLTAAVEEIPFDPDQPDDADPARVALPILLDAIPRMPVRTDIFGIGGTMTVMRVALRLLRRITDKGRLTGIVWAVLADTNTLSGRLTLLFLVGDRPNIGNHLVDGEVARAMEDRLRETLVAASADELAGESNSVGLAELMVETEEGREALLRLVEDDKVMLSLLVNSVGEARARSLGAAAVEVTEVLGWDRLVGYLGEELMARRTLELIEAVRTGGLTVSAKENRVVILAVDYATGHRPETAIDRIMHIQSTAQTAMESEDLAEALPFDPRAEAGLTKPGSETGDEKG